MREIPPTIFLDPSMLDDFWCFCLIRISLLLAFLALLVFRFSAELKAYQGQFFALFSFCTQPLEAVFDDIPNLGELGSVRFQDFYKPVATLRPPICSDFLLCMYYFEPHLLSRNYGTHMCLWPSGSYGLGKKCNFPPSVRGVVLGVSLPTHVSIPDLVYRIVSVRAYGKIKSLIKARKLCAHPFIELKTADKIVYMAPLSKQLSFYEC